MQMAKVYPVPKRLPKGANVDLTKVCGWLFGAGLSIEWAHDHAVIDWLSCKELPGWFYEIVAAHRWEIDRLARLRWLERHTGHRLMLTESANGEMQRRGVVYVRRRLEELRELCGNDEGYYDPAWPLAECCLSGYRKRVEDVERDMQASTPGVCI